VFACFRVPLSWKELVRRTIVDTFRDGCPGLAAQLAFYFLLALFPAVLVVISMLAYLPVEEGITVMLHRLEPVLPQDVFDLVRREIDHALQGGARGLLTVAVGGALWSSSSAMTAVITTLNAAYDITEWRPWWQTRLLAIGLSISLAVFTVAALVMIIGGADLGRTIASALNLGPAFEWTWAVVRWPVALGFVVFAVNLVYHFAPNADTRWVWISPGSLLATGLWLLSSLGFKLYVQQVSNVALVHGAIGSIIVLMLWLYLSGFALLVGAELNAEIDRALPSRDDGPQTPDRKKRIGPAADQAARA
jgi:membrane protein